MKKFRFLFFFTITSLFFASCQNFLEGDELNNQIKDQIEWASIETSNISVDVSEIPSGSYYVTIAWFADGTNTISSLHMKK